MLLLLVIIQFEAFQNHRGGIPKTSHGISEKIAIRTLPFAASQMWTWDLEVVRPGKALETFERKGWTLYLVVKCKGNGTPYFREI